VATLGYCKHTTTHLLRKPVARSTLAARVSKAALCRTCACNTSSSVVQNSHLLGLLCVKVKRRIIEAQSTVHGLSLVRKQPTHNYHRMPVGRVHAATHLLHLSHKLTPSLRACLIAPLANGKRLCLLVDRERCEPLPRELRIQRLANREPPLNIRLLRLNIRNLSFNIRLLRLKNRHNIRLLRINIRNLRLTIRNLSVGALHSVHRTVRNGMQCR